ncbi:MAG: hypothetical protein R2705_02030 [Ilumatobacteraceae bacterium]
MTYFIAQTWWMWAAVVILTWVGTAAAGWIRRAAPQRRSIARLQRELGDARTQIGRYEQRLEELDVERDLHLQEIDHLHDRLRAEHDVRLQLTRPNGRPNGPSTSRYGSTSSSVRRPRSQLGVG